MAERKKKSIKTSSHSKKENNTKDFSEHYGEITMWVLIALAIFLLVANFGMGGLIGKTVSTICFGLFGAMQYILPLIFFYCAALLVANKCSRKAVKKVVLCFVIVLVLCVFAEMFHDIEVDNLKKAYELASTGRSGGGAIGALILMAFRNGIGIGGTIILTLLILVIAISLITEIKFLSILKGYLTQEDKRASAKQKMSDAGEKTAASAEKIKEGARKLADRRDRMLRRARLKDEEGKTPASTIEVPDMRGPEKRKLHIPDDMITGGTPEFKPEISDEHGQTGQDVALTGTASDTPAQATGRAPRATAVNAPIIKRAPRTPKKTDNEAEVLPRDLPEKEIEGAYQFPSTDLLNRVAPQSGTSNAELRATADKLAQTLENFGVHVNITNISCGPAITRFELQPEQGVKVSKIVSLSDDIKLNLAAADIRIEAPIPGKAAIGIEIPNKTNQMVSFRELIESQEFKQFKSRIGFSVGKDLTGKPVIANIESMPHLLIAGATGSGKSVCINTIIMSILYKADPKDVKLIMIDPKVVELSVYEGIPHLLIPVVTDPKKAAGALNWAVMEMGERYKKFSEIQVRNIQAYNQKVEEAKKRGLEGNDFKKLPQIVVIVDELADLMMVASRDVEDAIVRLTQLARAAGIHLVIATQRPSVNVITGLIKANVPSRIAFAVSSGVDSRTIIDMNGAEKLLGKGDMLFYPQGYKNPIRVQGAFVSDEEVSKVVNFLKEQTKEDDQENKRAVIQKEVEEASLKMTAGGGSDANGRDEYFFEAAEFIIDKDKASIASLQRVFKIGFNRASRLMEQLCEAGVVGEEVGTKPRKVIMTMEQFEQLKEEEM
ncbi:MAG: DNA translocase FtsK [Lachnospiraceae bacterium]|nr:DNA translocase FtsK [Lachnospiraceae bacterium]